MTPALGTSVILILSFAALVTVHVGLALRLIAHRRPRWQGLLTLLPVTAWLAPYWGFGAGMRRLSWLWIGCSCTYIVSLVLSFVLA